MSRWEEFKEAMRLPGSPRAPIWLVYGAIILVVASWLPLAVVARMRNEPKSEPRIHIIQDMDKQPRYDAQDVSPLYADNRAMRPRIAGTIARGELMEDDHFNRGFNLEPNEEGKLAPVYIDGFPKQLTVDKKFVLRGQERFDIFCAACHGYDGRGNGAVHQRAVQLKAGMTGWVPPSNLLIGMPAEAEDGYLFNVITNGVRSMAAYGPQIPVEDRWAIVAYIRTLQRSQNGSVADVPEDQRGNISGVTPR